MHRTQRTSVGEVGAAIGPKMWVAAVIVLAWLAAPTVNAASMGASQTGQSVGALPSTVGVVAFTPDLKQAAFVPLGRRVVVLLDLGSGKETVLVALNPQGTSVPALEFSPDGTRLAVRLVHQGTESSSDEVQVVNMPPSTDRSTVRGPSVARNFRRTPGWNRLTWSPDGRWIPYVSSALEGEGFQVQLLDTSSGQSRPTGIGVAGAPDFQWTPGGGEIAVHVSDSTRRTDTIRVVSVATGKTRDIKIPGAFQEGRRLKHWLPGGDFVIRERDEADPGLTHVVQISERSVPSRRLCSTRAADIMEDERPNRAQGGFADLQSDLCLGITVDGRSQIVWRSESRRFHVRDLATDAEHPLTSGSGPELMGWLSPFSPRMVFVANRGGRFGVFLAEVGAKPVPPVLLEPVVGNAVGLTARWGPTGVIGKVASGEQHVYRAEIGEGPLGVKRGSEPRRLTDDTFDHCALSISPDSRRIAYWTERGLSIMNADGSGERVIMPNPSNSARSHPPEWRDLNELVVVVETSGLGIRFGLVDSTTGSVQERISLPRNDTGALRHWHYDRVRDAIVLLTSGPRPFTTAVNAYSIKGRYSTRIGEISTPDASIYNFLVSPDGSAIAYLSMQGNCKPCSFGLVSTSSWQPKTIAERSDYDAVAAWAPDNRYILYGNTQPLVMDTQTGGSSPLLSRPLQGFDGHAWASWSPDGAFVVFLDGTGSTAWRRWSLGETLRK